MHAGEILWLVIIGFVIVGYFHGRSIWLSSSRRASIYRINSLYSQ